MEQNDSETIVAQATAQGRGGVGIVRVSGPKATEIAKQILGRVPEIRQAEVHRFFDKNKNMIDEGIALFFKAPNSFTGEDVLELQGHGGPVIMDALIQEALFAGARSAQPGEFSQRAFLNNKIDLLQAEAIAELINARSQQAAKSAARSLQGAFSKAINQLLEGLVELRVFVESAIDFPDEDIPLLENTKIVNNLNAIQNTLSEIKEKARQGALLSESAKVVIIGLPNAGKSSLLNVLCGQDSAIVTDIPGTTRDVLRENISLDGLLLELVDTAGLREAQDAIEQKGVALAQKEIALAQHLIVVVDGTVSGETNPNQLLNQWASELHPSVGVTVLKNKIDRLALKSRVEKKNEYTVIHASVKTGEGMGLLRDHLKKTFGQSGSEEGVFIARRRHLEALFQAEQVLLLAHSHFKENRALELLAEDLRQAQQALESITGRFSSDDLLGKIFSEFCIGK